MRLEHLPVNPRLDAPLWGLVTDARPSEEVEVRSTMVDHVGGRWTGRAVFRADDGGRVDLAAFAPVEGSWRGSDAYGLYWSATPVADGERRQPWASVDLATAGLEPLVVELSFVAESGQEASASVRRRALVDVEVEHWRDEHIANAFIPQRETTTPGAVAVLGGSAGGFAWSNQVAALLATSGRAAVAVAYHAWDGSHGLSSSIAEIPLETFATALDRLRRHPRVQEGSTAVVGFSKGAEAALARIPVDVVAAVAPSSVVWEAARASADEPARSSWTWRSAALPYLAFEADQGFYEDHDKTRLLPFHVTALASPRARAAAIGVPSGGDVLLLSGTADTTWPAAQMAETILAERGGRRTHHHDVESAGHLWLPPGLPAGRWDGEPGANAYADRRGWAAIRRALRLS